MSGSEDGSLRVWDTLSRQCLRQVTPLKKHPLTNLQVKNRNLPIEVFLRMLLSLQIMYRSEVLGSGVTKSTLLPIAHLKKYAETNNSSDKCLLPAVVLGNGHRTTASCDKRGYESSFEMQLAAIDRGGPKKSTTNVRSGRQNLDDDFVSLQQFDTENPLPKDKRLTLASVASATSATQQKHQAELVRLEKEKEELVKRVQVLEQQLERKVELVAEDGQDAEPRTNKEVKETDKSKKRKNDARRAK